MQQPLNLDSHIPKSGTQWQSSKIPQSFLVQNQLTGVPNRFKKQFGSSLCYTHPCLTSSKLLLLKAGIATKVTKILIIFDS